MSTRIAAPAAQGDVTPLFVGFELSKSTWLIGLYAPELGSTISCHKIDGGDWGRAVALIETAKKRLDGRGKPVRVVSVYEAGYDGFWLHRALTAAGIENRVIDAASIPADRRSRRPKTDRLDLELLIRMLLALERGETRICRVVRVPTPTEEDAKRQHRAPGIGGGSNSAQQPDQRDPDDVGNPGRQSAPTRFSQASRNDEGRYWRSFSALYETDSDTRAPAPMPALERQIKEIEVAQAVALKATKVGDRKDERRAGEERDTGAAQAAALIRLKGLGQIGAVTLIREAFYRHFDNRREVASYFGLTPSPFNSGTKRVDQGISKAGNPRIRTLAIELSWLWLRHQPESALTSWFLQKVGNATGRIRRIAIVALARKLMIALWRYVTIGLIPEGAILRQA
jgi:transposase